MPLYGYKCNFCGRTEEQFRRVEDREKEFDCGCELESHELNDFKIISHKGNAPLKSGKIEYSNCSGTMQFQPIQKTNFTMHRMND